MVRDTRCISQPRGSWAAKMRGTRVGVFSAYVKIEWRISIASWGKRVKVWGDDSCFETDEGESSLF